MFIMCMMFIMFILVIMFIKFQLQIGGFCQAMGLLLLSKINGLLAGNVIFRDLDNYVSAIYKENIKLKQSLKWKETQLDNHHLYLKILKQRVSLGQIGKLYMEIVDFLNQVPVLRKPAKFIHNLIFRRKVQ